MSMPDEIELPEAEDFCRGRIKYGAQRCFIGWQAELFPKMSSAENERFSRHAVNIAHDMGLENTGSIFFASPPGFNDTKTNSKKKLAEWFRKTVAKMGYDIS